MTLTMLGVLVLAGCAGAGVQSSPSPSASVSVTATSTPTPDLTDPGNWVVGFGSVGPLKVGSTLADAGSALDPFTKQQQTVCPWLIILTSPTAFPGVSVWVPVGDDTIIDQLVVGDGSAGEVPHSPRTAAGIGLGSSVDQIMAAYPDAVVSPGRNESTVYSVTDGSGFYINMSVRSGAVNSLVTRDTTAIDGEYCG